ncbi:hypothetical protein QE380_003583 [Acinetobacter baylyi]|uniref:Uncharacterized protein n=1 Tax=Acinetobacter baylyi TaxID=202950 RepID=A0ABU0V1H0_ACIBI|nr:hypothetical protein [Acinetobacter baylyi]MDQ1210660.1 hypothetical protein [Acinetobacter baylyi]MDR6105744.1 hypothetical protein [Acinetobacter baylyi]MDR6187535.1 hypothetical protein [Acinetobacter baylyi]
MINLTLKSSGLTACLFVSILLVGCSHDNQTNTQEKVEIKAAPKLTNDATTYANEAWKLINQIDHYVYQNQKADLDDKVRKPLRKLSTDWRINVKMTDSVTEGKYALCRKALTSLDSWARETLDGNKTAVERKLDYERDKAQCKDAIANPNLGNTDPKR